MRNFIASILLVSVGKMSGGVEKYTLTLGHALEVKGFDVFYAVRKDGWLSSCTPKDRTLELDMSKMRLIFSMWKLKEYVENKNIQILHCNSNNGLFISLMIRENSKRKKVGVIHGDVLVDQKHKGKAIVCLYEKIEILLVKYGCSICISVSESIKKKLIKRGINSNKIQTVYSGIERINYNKKIHFCGPMISMCCVGNLIPVKNHMWLLRELREIKNNDPDIHFLLDVYGDGPERKNLEEYISTHDIEEVQIKGFCSNIRNILDRYDVFIQPSLYESFGLSVIEAMNAGCCVIVSSVGGMKEIVTEESGFLIDPTKDGQLFEVLKHISNNKGAAKDKAIKGKERMERLFSSDVMVDQVIRIYKDAFG